MNPPSSVIGLSSSQEYPAPLGRYEQFRTPATTGLVKAFVQVCHKLWKTPRTFWPIYLQDLSECQDVRKVLSSFYLKVSAGFTALFSGAFNILATENISSQLQE